MNLDPFSEQAIKRLFSADAAIPDCFYATEGETVECKAGFRADGRGWLRSIAALSNNKGGYIIFGVEDKSISNGRYKVSGLKTQSFSQTDVAELSQLFRKCFDPYPDFDIKMIRLGGVDVGLIYVGMNEHRPVIATQDLYKDELHQGVIYYRYHSESARIKHSELRSVLSDREARIRSEIGPMIDKLLKLGPDRAMVADLLESQLIDGKTFIRIDDTIVDSLNLIKEGHFTDQEGAPAYKLVGRIHVDDGSPLVVNSWIQPNDMLHDFIRKDMRYKSADYLRYASQSPCGKWLPLFFFLENESVSIQDAIKIVTEAEGGHAIKSHIIDRLRNGKIAFNRATGTPATYLEKMMSGNAIIPKDLKEAGVIAQATIGANDVSTTGIEALWSSLSHCLEIDRSSDLKGTVIGYIRRGIARLDEIVYGPAGSAKSGL